MKKQSQENQPLVDVGLNIYQYPPPKFVNSSEIIVNFKKFDLTETIKNFTVFVCIPYCQKRCNSCVFFKNILKDDHQFEEYIIALVKQIVFYGSQPRFKTASCLAVYFGGGTASMLSSERLSLINDALFSSFNVQKNTEITLEANPSHLTPEYIDGIIQSKINRLSIGVQSFNDNVLRMLNSTHSSANATDALRNLSDRSFTNVNVDFIYGIPGQTLKILINDVNKLLKYAPATITLYRYKIYPNSSMAKMIQVSKVQCPDHDVLNEMSSTITERLTDSGYRKDSEHTFSKDERVEKLYSKYTYKLSCDSIGLGAGAYSYINGYVFRTGNNVKEFMQNINNGNYMPYQFISEQATLKTRMKRYLMHNFQTGKVYFNEFERMFEIKVDDLFQDIIVVLQNKGFIIIDSEKIQLTAEGTVNKAEIFKLIDSKK